MKVDELGSSPLWRVLGNSSYRQRLEKATGFKLGNKIYRDLMFEINRMKCRNQMQDMETFCAFLRCKGNSHQQSEILIVE
jgi:hypothetical protein